MNQLSPIAPGWLCHTCGADLDGACPLPTSRCTIDSELVIHRLERAGATLLAMRTRSPYPAPYRCALPDPVRDIYDTWDWKEPATAYDNRPAIPNAAAVTAMDTTFRWLNFVPNQRHVVRRIVALRALVHPISGRHVCHWRHLGQVLHADYRGVQRWHADGISHIVNALAGNL
jgi:hypothetical protein